MEIKPFKIRDLTPEQSKIIQETVFKNGYTWGGGQTKVDYLSSKHLIFGSFSTKTLLHGPGNEFPNSNVYTNIPEITYQQFCDMYIKEEKFVLPEKWFCRITDVSRDTLNDWRINIMHYAKSPCVYPCMYENGSGGYNNSRDNHKEITFDQFKRYVLKEEQEGVCTNPSTSRGSCNEKEGCKQHCDSCEFYSLNKKEEVMNRDELLREAKRRYPIGTKYISLDERGRARLEQEAKYQPIWIVADNYGGIEVGVGYVYNLKLDKWAEIVQDTLKVEDLVEGKYYEFRYTDGETIIVKILSDGKMSGCGSTGRYTTNDVILPFYDTKIVEAQFSDRQWLEACIAANKFIPKEEALKSKEMKFEVGKWYKYNHDSDLYYLRCCNSDSDYFYYNQFINLETKRYVISESYYRHNKIGEEVPLSEIQQYLPDGHPDRIKDEWWKTLKKEDIVRCIANHFELTGRKIDQEYTIVQDFDGKIHYRDGFSSTQFEEFELVRRVNEVEKWSVGTYVVFTRDRIQGNNKPKGAIEKIVKLRSIDRGEWYSFEYSDGYCNDTQYTDKNPNDIKWFATLEEAKEFSKSLIGKIPNLNELLSDCEEVNKFNPSDSTYKHSIKKIEIYTKPQPIKEVEKFVELKIRKVNKIKI